MNRPAITGSREAASLHSLLVTAGELPEMPRRVPETISTLAGALVLPPWEDRIEPAANTAPGNPSDAAPPTERRQRLLELSTISGFSTLWQRAAAITDQLFKPEANSRKLPIEQFLKGDIGDFLVNLEERSSAQGLRVGPQLLLPLVALSAKARYAKKSGGDVDSSIAQMCQGIESGEIRPPKTSKQNPRRSIDTAAGSVISSLYGRHFNSKLATGMARTLAPLYKTETNTHVEAFSDAWSDLIGEGHVPDDMRPDMGAQLSNDLREADPLWQMTRVQRLTDATLAKRMTDMLVVLLADESVTFSELDEAFTRQPLRERAAAVLAKRKAEADSWHDPRALSQRLGLEHKHVMERPVLQGSDTEEPSTLPQRAETSDATQKSPPDLFRVATLARLKEEAGGTIYFRLSRQPEYSTDSGIDIRDVTGYAVLVLSNGDVVAENLRHGSTLVLRKESIGDASWEDVLGGTVEEAEKRGAVRVKHPRVEDRQNDFPGMLEAYTDTILDDLTAELKKGDRLRKPNTFNTIARALGYIASPRSR